MNTATRILARSISISIVAALAISAVSLESTANRSHSAKGSGNVYELSAAATTASATGSNEIGWD